MTGDTKERILKTALLRQCTMNCLRDKKELAVFVLYDGETKSVVGKLSVI